MMQRIPSIAATTSMAALIALSAVPGATHAPGLPPPRPSTDNYTAFRRTYPDFNVQPCLIGVATCAATYPPPKPCLASTMRCPADGRVEYIFADSR